MASLIVANMSMIATGLTTIAPIILSCSAAGLLVHVGFRLAAKLTNRGVGK